MVTEQSDTERVPSMLAVWQLRERAWRAGEGASAGEVREAFEEYANDRAAGILGLASQCEVEAY